MHRPMRFLAVLLLLGLTGCESEPVFMGRPASLWRKELKSPDSMARCHAVAAFAVMRPPVKAVIPDLVECLRDDAVCVRHEAAVALSTMGADAKAAVPTLLELTKDAHPMVREAAVLALQKIDPEAAALARNRPESGVEN